jgi:thiamine transporter 2/3
VQVLTALWSIFLIPPVKTSIYFHKKQHDKEAAVEKQSARKAFSLILQHFKISFTNETVLIWSIFYAISFCMYFLIFNYIQVLWLSISDNALWNATVDASFTLLSGIAMLTAGKIPLKYLENQKITMIILIVLNFFEGVIIFFTAFSSSLIECYILFVVYGIVHSFGITICATKIAENIEDDTHGLVFGFATFLALVLQSILMMTFVSGGFALSIVGQYLAYSIIYGTLGATYLIKLGVDMVKEKTN